MAVILTTLVAVLGIVNLSLRVSAEKKSALQAELLAREALEAVRSFRDNTDWSVDGLGTLTDEQSYRLVQIGSPLQWSLALGESIENGFTLSIVFSAAQRDGQANIVESGGSIDPATKKVTALISWQEQVESRQLTLVNFLTDWQ